MARQSSNAKGNAKRGTYLRGRSKKWLEERGWDVAILERMRTIPKPRGKPHYVKYDTFGADLVAMNGKTIAFINSKGGRKHLSEGRKEFAKYQYPPGVKCWLMIWEPYARKPEIEEVEH